MKVSSVMCFALILLGSIASLKLKTSTKNFTLTCKNYSKSEDNSVLSAVCKNRRGFYNKQGTSINLVENLIFRGFDDDGNEQQIGRCVPEEADLKGFSYKLYCNLKLDDGSIKKFTGNLNLSIYIENIDGSLEMTRPLEGLEEDFFINVVDTPEREDL